MTLPAYDAWSVSSPLTWASHCTLCELSFACLYKGKHISLSHRDLRWEYVWSCKWNLQHRVPVKHKLLHMRIQILLGYLKMPGKHVPQCKSFVNLVPFLIKKEKGIGDDLMASIIRQEGFLKVLKPSEWRAKWWIFKSLLLQYRQNSWLLFIWKLSCLSWWGPEA